MSFSVSKVIFHSYVIISRHSFEKSLDPNRCLVFVYEWDAYWRLKIVSHAKTTFCAN